jgi:hypothetical protein
MERSDEESRVSLPSFEVDFPLSAAKAKEIQECLSKGRLKISVSKVDLASGRLGDGWKYD